MDQRTIQCLSWMDDTFWSLRRNCTAVHLLWGKDPCGVEEMLGRERKRWGYCNMNHLDVCGD